MPRSPGINLLGTESQPYTVKRDAARARAAGLFWRPENFAMRVNRLVRVGGWAAILAGVLRAGVSFVSGNSDVERQSFYFIVDLPRLLRVFAAYAQNHEATSIAFTFEGVTIPVLTTRIHTSGPCGEQAGLKA